MIDSEALQRELLETFQLEAREHVDALGALLVALEREEDAAARKAQVEGIFRHTHTLKGAAHAVNLIDVAGRCQELESLFSELKRGAIELDTGLFDRLHGDIDDLSARIFDPAGGPPGAPAPAGSPAGGVPAGGFTLAAPPPLLAAESAAGPGATSDAPDRAAGFGAFRAPPEAPGAVPGPERRAPGAEKTAGGETVRVPTRLLESLLLQVEELVSAKLAAFALVGELTAAAGELDGRSTARSRALELAGAALRKPGPDLDAARLAGVVQEFCESERKADLRLRSLERGAVRNLRALSGLVDPLMEGMKKLHLLPFSTLTDPFSKVVRDLSRELDKEAELHCCGGELEIDRRILAELKEPLLHIMRNVMDHGIEKGPERAGRGKPPRGRISVDLRLRDANHAELSVSDDGRGIDPAQVKATALRLELIAPEAAGRLGDAEALQLIFESGFSTSPMITTLSGRGVGLAIARASLERLGGHLAVSSVPGRGTTFRLVLPLSFALINGLQVEAGGRACILPAANVELTARLPLAEIRSVENRDTALLGGELFSLVSLAGVLGLGTGRPASSEQELSQQMVLLRAGDRRIAFAVDRVIGVQEVLVKPLGRQLSRVRNVAGATVLGNGSVVPVLNIHDLVRSALLGPVRTAPWPSRGPGAGPSSFPCWWPRTPSPRAPS